MHDKRIARRRVAVSALEASSAALPHTQAQSKLPETPAGRPRRRARLQQTPRTPAETAARFERLVRATAAMTARGSAPSQQTAAAADGNTSEDEELLRIQKRLVFSTRRKRETPADAADGNDANDDDDDDVGSDDDAPPPPPPKTRSDQRERLSTSFSVLEDVDALPKPAKPATKAKAKASGKRASTSPRTSSKTLVLSEWTLQWPPEVADDGRGQLQLVLEGKVSGHAAAFHVARRVNDTQFVAASGESVRLDGCLDVEKSDARGVPDDVLALLLEGLPSRWRHKLQALLQSTRQAANSAAPPVETSKTRASKTRTPAKRGIVRAAAVSEASEPENEDAVTTLKRSRSGRVLTPVMDWWRGERLKTDVNGVTVVDPGSPAFLSSERVRAPAHRATTPRKPPRTPTATKPPRARSSAVKAKQAPTSLRTQQQQLPPSDASEWSEEQLQALAAAKMQIPTTATNFWVQVATFVTGKSADECRTKSFEAFASPTSRANKSKRKAAGAPASASKIPTKLHRAGSNLFKKQVRAFVTEYEKKHVDDVFADVTPTKRELVHGALGLDDLQSPSAPLDASVNLDDEDDDDADQVGGRELLQEITATKRDEVDSYVLSLKRSRLLGEPAGVAKPSSFLTPSTLKKKTKTMKRAVHMYEDVGSRRVEGVVSPGGTTRVRINKDSDATSDDDEDEQRDSDEEDSDAEF